MTASSETPAEAGEVEPLHGNDSIDARETVGYYRAGSAATTVLVTRRELDSDPFLRFDVMLVPKIELTRGDIESAAANTESVYWVVDDCAVRTSTIESGASVEFTGIAAGTYYVVWAASGKTGKSDPAWYQEVVVEEGRYTSTTLSWREDHTKARWRR